MERTLSRLRPPDCEAAGPRRIAYDDAPSARGKVRREGSSAANKQRSYAVPERGRLHGASEISASKRNRGIEHRVAYYCINKSSKVRPIKTAR